MTVIRDLSQLAGMPADRAVYVQLEGADLDAARAQVEKAARQVGRRVAPGARCDGQRCFFCLWPVGATSPARR